MEGGGRHTWHAVMRAIAVTASPISGSAWICCIITGASRSTSLRAGAGASSAWAEGVRGFKE
jgi:hypothetical protein